MHIIVLQNKIDTNFGQYYVQKYAECNIHSAFADYCRNLHSDFSFGDTITRS